MATKVSQDQLLEAIDGMTVLELSEFIKKFEERYGVTAAAPVAVAAAPAAGGAPAAGAPAAGGDEQSEFSAVLSDVGPNKIPVIKVVRELTGLGLKEAKDLVDAAPKPIKEGIAKEEADKIKAALENGVSEVRELAGRFPQVSGIVAEVDLKAPVGERVKSVKINGEPLDPTRTYKVATNDFMARGGDGYRAFIGAKSLIDISASQLMASQVIDYVEKAKKVA